MKKKLVWLPYDFDTALGINNEGSLVFGYELEDTDHLEGGANVFNGQDSVVWNNLRDAFKDELAEMYRELRSQGILSYETVERMFEEHQGKWSEAIFNEDAWFKYILPLIDDGSGAYLDMLQGSKAEQRKWWLYNRFRYIDSKYNAGDALSDLIQLRSYAKSDITIIPYADIYPTVKFGSYLVSHRGKRGQETLCECPLTTLNDTETYIYSASQLASVGDLSGLKVGFADFAMATKLQSLKVGDASADYNNPNLKTLTLGNNVLLKTIDVRNCSALASSIDVSGCSNVEEIYFDGTAITGVQLPIGGVLRVLHLPDTITNLTIRNQNKITDLVAGYANLSTLRIENSAVDSEMILRSAPAGTRVRLIGFRWEAADYAEIVALCDLLDTMRGLDEQGGNVDTAQVSGTIHTAELTGEQIAAIKERYPYLTLTADRISATLTYKAYDGSSTIATETVYNGGDGTKTNSTSRSSDAQYTYTPDGWATAPNGNKDANALKNVTADRTVYAAYSKTLRSYTVSWVKASADGGGTLQTKTYTYGTSVNAASAYTGSTPTSSQGSAEDYPFEGWNPTSATVQGDTTFTAKFGSPIDVSEISDSWDQIIAAIDAGTYATKYKLGQYKPLDLGTEGTVNMQIVAFDADELASGNGYAPITFIGMELLGTSRRVNSVNDSGGWESCELRKKLKSDVLPLIPQNVSSRLCNVVKTFYRRYPEPRGTYETNDRLWIPSVRELYFKNTITHSAQLKEDRGAEYSAVYNVDKDAERYKKGRDWWVRSSFYSSYSDWTYVKNNTGWLDNNAVSTQSGVCLGFCLGLEQPTITDTWDEILAAEQDGTYKTKYSIGDTVQIDLGEEGSHLFEIVAFDADELADGNGTAPITWISKTLLNTSHRMNTEREGTSGDFKEGTGSIGGWDKSEMKKYLLETIAPTIPSEVGSKVKTVTKYSRIFNTAGSVVNDVATEETFWIPSRREVLGVNNNAETIGPIYSDAFADDVSRTKAQIGTSSKSRWWLRSAAEDYSFVSVQVSGGYRSRGANYLHGVALGFCT